MDCLAAGEWSEGGGVSSGFGGGSLELAVRGLAGPVSCRG